LGVAHSTAADEDAGGLRGRKCGDERVLRSVVADQRVCRVEELVPASELAEEPEPLRLRPARVALHASCLAASDGRLKKLERGRHTAVVPGRIGQVDGGRPRAASDSDHADSFFEVVQAARVPGLRASGATGLEPD
jgi:hypothetical protein